MKVVEESKKLDLFDFVNAINYSKVDLMAEDGAEKKYNVYMVNRALSFHSDTIFWANMMNSMPQLDKKLQFSFFLNSIRPAKRFGWIKGEKSEDVSLVQHYYGYSAVKAKAALRLLTPENLKTIRQRLDHGGKNTA